MQFFKNQKLFENILSLAVVNSNQENFKNNSSKIRNTLKLSKLLACSFDSDMFKNQKPFQNIKAEITSNQRSWK